MYNSVMEIANSRTREIRQANTNDRGEIFRLIREANFAHVHSDWYLPSDWLGNPGFIINEQNRSHRSSSKILGCMAATADPLPAAWMRLVALNSSESPEKILTEMFEAVLPVLRSQGIDQLAWLPGRFWPQQWFQKLGFEEINWITTFVKDNLDIPTRNMGNVEIRPVNTGDFIKLAKLEENAFSPLWRHSAQGLTIANQQAVSFLVAQIDDQIVGFQYSVPGQQPASVHLVRITVHRQFQSRGIGTALMAAAFEDYRRYQATSVSLNTQIDNIPSHRLYKRFGFYQLDDAVPLWARRI